MNRNIKELYRLIVGKKWIVFLDRRYADYYKSNPRNLYNIIELESPNKMLYINVYLYNQSRA